jgi:four helix bundle protein
MENTETQTWLEFALACGYIDEDLKNSLMMQSDEVGRLLHHMINNPEKYR